MKNLISLALALTSLAFSSNPLGIIAGIDAVAAPYTMRLVLANDVDTRVGLFPAGMGWCGATQVSESIVLTAAHCILEAPFFDNEGALFSITSGVLAVAHSTSRLENQLVNPKNILLVESIAIHPSYDAETKRFDVAVIRLKEPYRNTYAVLATEPARYDYAVVQGFGDTLPKALDIEIASSFPDTLQEAREKIITTRECVERSRYYLHASQLCATGYDAALELEAAKRLNELAREFNQEFVPGTCQGDSGSGLIQDNILVGIVSSGVGCGLADYASIYSNIYWLYNIDTWLKEHLNTKEQPPMNILEIIINFLTSDAWLIVVGALVALLIPNNPLRRNQAKNIAENIQLAAIELKKALAAKAVGFAQDAKVNGRVSDGAAAKALAIDKAFETGEYSNQQEASEYVAEQYQLNYGSSAKSAPQTSSLAVREPKNSDLHQQVLAEIKLNINEREAMKEEIRELKSSLTALLNAARS